MTKFLVSGLINIETTLKITGFPLHYNPVNYPFFGIRTTVSGVGYNVALALKALDDEVLCLSVIGHDFTAQRVLEGLRRNRIDSTYIIAKATQTAQSVILYDDEGNRQIHVDLKDVQEQEYPIRRFDQAMPRADRLILCNINFSRPFLQKTKDAGKEIATDVHAISSLEDDYNREFMQTADILFMSDEQIPVAPAEFGREVMRCYKPKILVIGMGIKGAMLFTRDEFDGIRVNSVQTRPIVNTVGAGDALFSAFMHCHAEEYEPLEALKMAVVFASYKISASSAAEGFLDHRGLCALYKEVQPQFGQPE